MEKDTTPQRILSRELPGLLARLEEQQAVDLVLIGRTGSLSASSDGWREELVGRSVYQLTDVLPELPRELLRLSRLQALTLRNLSLGDGDAVAIALHLGQLSALDLSENQIDEVGACAIAEHLNQLNVLDLNYNRVGDVGARTIAEHLDKLTKLALSGNQIGETGAHVIAEHLGQLTVLDLNYNELGESSARAIAEHLGQLTSLNLNGSGVGDAGASAIADHLGQLTTLRLWANSIGEGGARAIAKGLRHLTKLDLSQNRIGEAGARAVAEHLTQLTTLNLSFNRLGDDAVQAIVERLDQLTELDLEYSEVGEVGVQAIAGSLDQLTTLDLSGNAVGDSEVRAIAERLGLLKTLSLDNNQIGDAGARAISEGLGLLTTLELGRNQIGDTGARTLAERLGLLSTLHLNGNQLGDTGACAIAERLGQLTTLDLSSNKLGEMGARAIAEYLGQLTILNLSSNQIGDSGACAIAEHLSQLKTLSLGGNEVGDVGASAIAEHSSQLITLDLSDNQVGDVGAGVIARHLVQLAVLNLSENRVGDVAVTTIGRHQTGLDRLVLASNDRITNVTPLAHSAFSTLNLARTAVVDLSPLRSLIGSGLPVKWSDTSWERGILVEDCPLANPSPEVVQQGPEAVRNYFREIDAQGVDRLFEAKLLIVGEGGAGKTSLVRRLFRPDMDLPGEKDTTLGIDIEPHEFPIPGGRRFRLNTWDFGGQQIYHATHQFFLTKRSLYVLVDDTRSDHRSIHDEGFKFWLEVVETLSESSPLLIFQNEKGGRSKSIDEGGIKGRFPNVKEIYRGNLELADAANGLRQAVELFAQQLPHIGEAVPAKWVAIREDLEDLAQSRPYISLDEYFEVYSRHLALDRDKALHLSQYLHDLGVFLHFHNPRELRRTVFLQNSWVTDAVFRILDDEQVKAQLGRFTLADCDRLWADRGYVDKEVELRALMERFELSYRLHDTDPETWLVPQHLSPSKPEELGDWARTGDLMHSYRYDFLPRGLISRLMVRMHRFVGNPDLCWSSGALFERSGTRVLVETTQRGNEIALRSRGPEQKELLSVIASDLDALNDSFQGLKDRVEKWVPCLCATCVRTTTPELYAYKRLLKRKQDHKLTIECPESYADVSVLELLDGLKLESLPDWANEPPAADEGIAIAVSFPGEHRSFVLEVVERLAQALGRDRVFYDEWFEAGLLGRSGDLKLQAFYEQAELVVPFFSEHYSKPWCSLEWETIRGILLNRRGEDAVIPVHLDDTEVPGWPAVSFGIEPKGRTAEQIADLILEAYRKRHPVGQRDS